MAYQFIQVFLLTVFILLAGSYVSAQTSTIPAGFTESLIASNIAAPTTMQFAPDGRIFIAQQNGNIRIVENNVLLSTPFLSISVNSTGERGLLGIAFDPNFATNQYIYIYYTTSTSPIHNRVSRVTANGNIMEADSENILLELNNLSGATNHNGGAMHFGPDGKLYIAVGDNANGLNSQSFDNLLGKILRINPDGSIPTDNPFYSSTTGNNRAIWTLGLRNPFNFAFQPGTGRMFINDVGQNTWEEINDGITGSNYGWPTTEGPTSNPSFRSPLYAYQHLSGECSIIGSAFYNPTALQFPASYTGDYFYADYCASWIRHYDPVTDTVEDFATNTTNAIVDVKIASDGSLYYLTRGGSGRVYRIEYNSGQPPSITQHPTSESVAIGEGVTFTCSGTGQAPLSYQWQRDTINIPGENSTTYTLSSVDASDNGATFRCIVTNSFGNETSNDAVLTVLVSNLPTATIDNPTDGSLYNAGDTVGYSGTGTDPEDGILSNSAFTWEVIFHHDVHSHPFIPLTSGVSSGTFTIPIVSHASTNVWYRIHLRVTDSDGLTDETFHDIYPQITNVTLQSNPERLTINIDGIPYTTPITLPEIVGTNWNVEAVSPQTLNGNIWIFDSWSDNRSQTHLVNISSTGTALSANFVLGGAIDISDNNETKDEKSFAVSAEQSSDNEQQPLIKVFDPAISKIGILLPGQLGVNGENLQWEVTVANRGSVAGSNVVVTDTLRSELQIDRVDAPGANVTINGQTVRVEYASLAGGSSVKFRIYTTVLDGVEVSNVACVHADNISSERCTAPANALRVTRLPSTGEAPLYLAILRLITIIGGIGLIGKVGYSVIRKKL